MFAGREAELRKLEGIFESKKFECVIIHGRWRAGKTSLIREFIKKKKAIFFSAQEIGSGENLKYLADCIGAFPQEPDAKKIRIGSYGDALEQLFRLTRTERVVFVIDDYQFLAASHRDISRLICEQIDRRLIDSRLMLVVCGSSPLVMEREALSYSSPFHGRRTAKIEVAPFTFSEARRHFGGFSPYDIAIMYGVTGGVPKYLGHMDPGLPVEENIRRAMLDPSSPLFEEPANILRLEVRDLTFYNAILTAIASGLTKNSEIAGAVGLETSACTAYLKNLIALGIVSKHTPITEKAGKKTLYEIGDGFFRFWYRFIPHNMSLIQAGMASKIWRGVASGIPSFMHTVFEDICRQWLQQANLAGQLPARFVEFGRWWGVDPVWKDAASLPIVAYSDNSHALFADCVWSDEPAHSGALVSLAERSRLFRYAHKHLYLFSRSGFSSECAESASRVGANLVLFE